MVLLVLWRAMHGIAFRRPSATMGEGAASRLDAHSRVPLQRARFFVRGTLEQMRIGFAFNQKPEADGETSEEPPSPAPAGNDRYAEWDDADTIDAVEQALRRAGEVTRLEADRDFPDRLRAANPDIVFNIAEGWRGPSREAHVPAICEFFGVPHTASGPLTLGLALDKRRAKEVFLAYGIATPRWTVLGDIRRNGGPPGGGPWIVKPLHEGSSKGISVRSFCATAAEAKRQAEVIMEEYGQPALVEEFLHGREFTVAVLGNGATARALPAIEIRLEALPPDVPRVYGWEAKWLWDSPGQQMDIYRCPAPVEPALARALADTAVAAFHALGCLDWARVDLRLDAAGVPHVLEVNPLPGILPDPAAHSFFPAAARAAGIAYDDLMVTVLDLALERYGLTR
jgi:D-alanine-D-alanine ligase